MHVPREQTHEPTQIVTRRTSVKRVFSHDTPFGKILGDDLRKMSNKARRVREATEIVFSIDPALTQSGLPAGMVPDILRERFPGAIAPLAQ